MIAWTRRITVCRGSVLLGLRAEIFCDVFCSGLEATSGRGTSGGGFDLESFAGLACNRVDLCVLMTVKGESNCGGLARRADPEDGRISKEDVDARFVVVEDGAESMALENWYCGVRGAGASSGRLH